MDHGHHILGLDPGRMFGFALHNYNAIVASGVWDLQQTRHDSPGMKFIRLRSHLQEIATAYPRLHVCYEAVVRHAGTHAAHMYGGYVAIIQAWCQDCEYEYEGVRVADVKRLATGKGNANKEAMLAAAQARWPSAAIENHNEADARLIAECVARTRDIATCAGPGQRGG
jgi:Holliday junction resolvasome RuvABC endonuclease subunit